MRIKTCPYCGNGIKRDSSFCSEKCRQLFRGSFKRKRAVRILNRLELIASRLHESITLQDIGDEIGITKQGVSVYARELRKFNIPIPESNYHHRLPEMLPSTENCCDCKLKIENEQLRKQLLKFQEAR